MVSSGSLLSEVCWWCWRELSLWCRVGCLDSILTVSGPDLAMRKLIFLDPAAPQARQYSDLGQHQHNTNITDTTRTTLLSEHNTFLSLILKLNHEH